MRMSELARESGLPVATIKYYLREGLLPPGEPTARTQAEYSREHLDRLRLVRALVEVGRLPLATVRTVLAALEGATSGSPRELGEVIRTVNDNLPPRTPENAPEPVRALAAVQALGWRINPSSSALQQLESALASVEAVGLPAQDEVLEAYGEAALRVASSDIGSMPDAEPAAVLRHVVVGTVLYEPVLTALRRLAMQHLYVARHASQYPDQYPEG